MAKDADVDKSVAAAQENVRKGEELARQVAEMQEQTAGLFRQYGIDPNKVSAFLAGGQMTAQDRAAIQKEQARLQEELERDLRAAEEQARSKAGTAAKAAPRPKRKRNMV